MIKGELLIHKFSRLAQLPPTYINFSIIKYNINNVGDWGLGIGDRGFGDWGLGPIPNPQSPSPIPILYKFV